MNTRLISVPQSKEWLIIVVVVLIMMLVCGCETQATATVAAADTQPPAPTETEVPPTDTPEPPTATPTPEPTPTPTEESTATPDLEATAKAEAAAAEEAVIAEINEKLEAIGYSTETGSLGWVQVGVEEIKMDPYNPELYAPFAEDLVAADFVLYTEITWESTTGLAGCGFFFRSEPNNKDGATYLFTTLRLSGLPGWQIGYNKFERRERNITDIMTAGAIDQGQGAMNKYIFIAEEGKFTLYINDQRIGSYYDYTNTLPEGRFAFLGWQESGDSTCSYENSWVWLLTDYLGTIPEEFRVGLVTDTGGIDDKSFNATIWKGVQRAEEELGVQAQFIQSDEATQYEPNLTEFASQGYDLTIATSFFLGGDLAKVAAEYPDNKFTVVDYTYPDPWGVPEGMVGNDECIPNVQGQIFKTDQAAFLAGYLAAGMTKTGKLGFFSGANIPTVTIFSVGFQKGMEYYNDVHGTNVELIGWDNDTGEGLFTGDFMDLTKGKEATESLFDEGADIFISVGGLIGSRGFDVARERGGLGIWVDVDGYYLLPEARDVLLTSVMKNMDNSVFDVIQATLEGNFNGCGVYVGSLENDGVGIADYHELADQVPAELKAEVEELRQKIISGEITDTGCISYPQYCLGGLY